MAESSCASPASELSELISRMMEDGASATEAAFKEIDKAVKKAPHQSTPLIDFFKNCDVPLALALIAGAGSNYPAIYRFNALAALDSCRKRIGYTAKGLLPFPLFVGTPPTEDQLTKILPALGAALIVTAAGKAEKAASLALDFIPLAEHMARILDGQGLADGLPGFFKLELWQDLAAPFDKALLNACRQVAMYYGSATVVTHSLKTLQPRLSGHAGISASTHQAVRQRLLSANKPPGLSSFTHPRRKLSVSGNNAALMAIDAIVKCGLAPPERIVDALFPGLASSQPETAFTDPGEEAKQIILPLMIDGIETNVVATPVVSVSMLYDVKAAFEQRRAQGWDHCPAHAFASHIDGNPQNAGVLITDNARRDGSLLRLTSLPQPILRKAGSGLAYRLTIGQASIKDIVGRALKLKNTASALDQLAKAGQAYSQNIHTKAAFQTKAADVVWAALYRLREAVAALPKIKIKPQQDDGDGLIRRYVLSLTMPKQHPLDYSDALRLASQAATPVVNALAYRKLDVSAAMREDVTNAFYEALRDLRTPRD